MYVQEQIAVSKDDLESHLQRNVHKHSHNGPKSAIIEHGEPELNIGKNGTTDSGYKDVDCKSSVNSIAVSVGGLTKGLYLFSYKPFRSD